MGKRERTREITVTDKAGTFNTFFKRLAGEQHEYDFEGLSALRRVLSNERAKVLSIIKQKKPSSLYALAKLAGRDFKAISEDIALLNRFGFVDLIAEHTGKRRRLKPILTAETVHISIKL